MNLREPYLPSGWYPREKEKIEEFLEIFSKVSHSDGPYNGAIAPHAGWYYSGLTAAAAVSCLDREAQTVAVIGGHLPAGAPVLMAGEDGVRTPFGILKIDRELGDVFVKKVSPNAVQPDRYTDNTVEVLLPMVHYFFPGAKLLWLRFPADIDSYNAGKLLAESANDLKRRMVVLGSTDLTHYGANYGFLPKGRGEAALKWVKEVNDRRFIEAVLNGDPSEVINRADNDSSSCSAGAVLGAMGFAASGGRLTGCLLDYSTSADRDEDVIPDSFVGYTAIGLKK